VKEGNTRGNDQDQERQRDREERGERDGRRESDKEARSSRGREATRRSESTGHEEGKRRLDRSRSCHRDNSEGSKEDSGKGKKERRFREEKAQPKDTDTPTTDTAMLSTDSPLAKVVEELAAMVAVSGEELEEAARSNSSRAADLDFLEDKTSALYMRYRARVAQLKSDGRQEGKRKRKSRWGAQESPVLELVPGGPGLALPTALGTVVAPAPIRSPAMMAYAAKIFGGVELTEDQWKHCEIQLQMNTLMTSKPVGVASNVDEGGTWEHKLRQAEIERTAGSRWHQSDQQLADDDPPISHHISHFLPPEEMAKFMQKQKVLIVGSILCPLCSVQCFQYCQLLITSLRMSGKLGVKSESFGFDSNGKWSIYILNIEFRKG